MTEPLRVLHVVGLLEIGGIQNWLIDILRRRDAERFVFDFCETGRPSGGLAAEAEGLGARVWSCPLRKFGWRRRFRRILREGAYDVVHCHRGDYSGFILGAAVRAGASRRIAHYHLLRQTHPADWVRRAVLRMGRLLVRRRATPIVGCARAVLEANFGPAALSDPRRRVVYYGSDLGAFPASDQRDAVRAELGLPPDAPVVGHVGRFAPQKNHALLLEVARELRERMPEARWLFVGDGPLRGEIERRAREAGLAERIVFAGTRRDVPRMLSAMDLFFLPSLWEGLPVALMEAQAAGVPILSAPLPGLDEVLPPEPDCCILREGEGAVEAARRAEEILRDDSLRRRLSSRGRERAERFDIRESAAALERLYLPARGAQADPAV